MGVTITFRMSDGGSIASRSDEDMVKEFRRAINRVESGMTTVIDQDGKLVAIPARSVSSIEATES